MRWHHVKGNANVVEMRKLKRNFWVAKLKKVHRKKTAVAKKQQQLQQQQQQQQEETKHNNTWQQQKLSPLYLFHLVPLAESSVSLV